MMLFYMLIVVMKREVIYSELRLRMCRRLLKFSAELVGCLSIENEDTIVTRSDTTIVIYNEMVLSFTILRFSLCKLFIDLYLFLVTA